MSIDWAQVEKIITGLIGLAGLVMGIFNWRERRALVSKIESETKKTDAETTETTAKAGQVQADAVDKLVETAMQFVEPLKAELAEERRKRVELETRFETVLQEMQDMRWLNAQLQAGIARLVHQIESLGHKPVFNPETDLQKRKNQ